MKITIIACGKMKDRSLLSLYNEYMKRVPWSIDLKEISVKSVEQEKQKILTLLPDNATIVILDEKGEAMTSTAFADQIHKWGIHSSQHIVFVIGGADGVHKEVLKRGHKLLSFGKMTWPHLLVRVLLAEQLYRAYTISRGHPYHRE